MKAISKIIILSVLVVTLACSIFAPKQPGIPAVTCVEPPLGLISWWRGEGDAADSAGNHDGMLMNDTAFESGKVGRAFSFDGADDFVEVPDSDLWTFGTDGFTVDLWVKFNQIQSRTPFIGHDEGGGSTNKWIFWYDELGDDGLPGSALRFHINPSTGLRNPIFAIWTPSVGQWYHVAITRNASTYAMYIDGTQVATSVHTDEITNAAAPLTIGESEGFFFNGLIDEVHIFSNALSQSEIHTIFSAESDGLCVPNALSAPIPSATISATQLPNISAETTLNIGSTQLREKDGMLMVYVPSGPFTMGSDEDSDAENPAHTVTVDAFWMDQTEVTNSMFQAFVQSNNYQTEAERIGKAYFLDLDSKSWWRMEGVDWLHPQGPGSSLTGLSAQPVVEVSWNDASAYCVWAGGRLPSEAEWEKAARGTDERAYPWGDAAPNGNLLNFADVNLDVSWADKNIDDGNQLTASVDSYPDGVSPYGALNMAGNVWEWVSDWYDVYPGGDKSASSDFGVTYRVLRGGSWDYQNSYARSAYRLRGTPYDAGGNIGFRCARSQELIPSVTVTAETNSPLTPVSPTVFTCPLAPKPRVKIGDMARIVFTTGQTTRLRSAPEAGDNVITMLTEGTDLKIIGGPVCYPRPGRNDAYVYWKVSVTSNSQEGWVAEGDSDAYYIEPVTTLSSEKIYFSVNGNLYRMNLDGSDREIVSNIGLSERFFIDSSQNKIYISRWDSQSQILVFDLQSKDKTFIDGPGSGGQGIAVDPTTSKMFLGLYYQGVYVIDMNNGGDWSQLVDAASLSPMLGQRGQLGIDSANRRLYFRSAFNGDCGLCRYIWRVDFDGNNLTKIIPANGGDALALDLTEGKMYFSDVPGHGTIMRANLDGSGSEVVFTIPEPYSYCWTIVLDMTHKKMYMTLFDETNGFKEKAIARSNMDGTEFEILYEKAENTAEEASGDMDLYLP